MTRKEAIENLKGLLECTYVDSFEDAEIEALRIAIKALEKDEKYAELRKRVQEFMMKENMFSINSRDFDNNFFDTAESEGEHG